MSRTTQTYGMSLHWHREFDNQRTRARKSTIPMTSFTLRTSYIKRLRSLRTSYDPSLALINKWPKIRHACDLIHTSLIINQTSPTTQNKLLRVRAILGTAISSENKSPQIHYACGNHSHFANPQCLWPLFKLRTSHIAHRSTQNAHRTQNKRGPFLCNI